MEKCEAWLSQAKRNLDFAKFAINGYQEHAYLSSMLSGEMALKSLLIWSGVSSENSGRFRTHNMSVLIEEIEKMGKVPTEVLNNIKRVVLPSPIPADTFLPPTEPETSENSPRDYLSHQDIAYSDSPGSRVAFHISCESEQAQRMRYPYGNVPPSKYISESDARKKIVEAEEVLSIIERIIKKI